MCLVRPHPSMAAAPEPFHLQAQDPVANLRTALRYKEVREQTRGLPGRDGRCHLEQSVKVKKGRGQLWLRPGSWLARRNPFGTSCRA